MASRLLSAFLIASFLAPLPAQEPTDPEPHETVVVSGTGGERPGAAHADLSAVETQILKRTNAFRKQQKREPVEPNESLTKAAQAFADYMADTGRYSHHADGRTPAGRVDAAGYELCIVRENIAYAFRSNGFSTDALAGQFFVGWKDSPGHRRNMLAEYVSDTAVAIAKSEETDVYFAVQLFARPKSEAVTFEVINKTDLTVSYRIEERAFSLPPGVIQTHAECVPRTVEFLPASPDPDAAEPSEPVDSVKVTGGERLTVESAASGYRVTVVEREETRPD